MTGQRHVVGHATIGIDVIATQATEPADTVDAIRERVLAVAADLRAKVAEHERDADGELPMDHPMALWCDTVINVASRIEDAIRAPVRGEPVAGAPLDQQPPH